MNFSDDWLVERIMFLIPLILSLSVHEWAHAWAASCLGDDTARLQGRLTLNPLAHIDPVGTVLLPLLGVPFGWAKPVPIEPTRFRRTVTMRMGVLLTAVAGPVSNLLIAVGCAVAQALLLHYRKTSPHELQGVLSLLEMLVFMNLALALFNMIPVPPLDGSRVVDGLLPDRLRPAWDGFSHFSYVALLVLILAPQVLLGMSLLSVPLEAARELLQRLIG